MNQINLQDELAPEKHPECFKCWRGESYDRLKASREIRETLKCFSPLPFGSPIHRSDYEKEWEAGIKKALGKQLSFFHSVK